MINKVILIIIGILIILFGLFLSFGILIYSGKESDDSGYYYLIGSFSILVFGISILRKGIILKRNV